MSVSEKAVDFKRFEQEVFQGVCQLGREWLREVLERYDAELSMNRDKKVYRAKGLRKTTLKTVMGEVEYTRTMYEVAGEDNASRTYVYLLDEAMGIGGNGNFSALLSEMIAKAACESPYRAVARSVSELTGQTISHTAAWNVIQRLGEQRDKQEKEAAALSAKGEGKLETAILFEEMDGIYLNLQGKSRKEQGSSKEMKVSIAYDGAKKVGRNRYSLTNKVATANFESAKRFRMRKEGAIAAVYNTDEINTRFLNGDGAAWIKESAEADTHVQLDHFHISQAIIRYLPHEEVRRQIRDLLYSKQTDLLLDVIEAYANSTEDEKERKNYRTLLTYFQNNKDGLIPCHRRGLNLPPPSEGKAYRRLGAMESNIFTIIGNRMKGGRACWSIDGGNNLARLLCLKATDKLTETLQSLTSVTLPERYAEEIEIKMSAAKVPMREGKGYNGFQQAAIPSSLPWLKDMVAMRPVC